MARIRTIKPDFFTSDDIGELSEKARLLYIALWTQVDCEGKCKFARTKLMTQCMPFDMSSFDSTLDELAANGHCIVFEDDGIKILYLPTFTEHQKPHHTESSCGFPDYNGDQTVITPSLNGEKKVGKGKGKVYRKGKCSSGDDRFEQFWKAYPKKKNKGQAEKAFKKLNGIDIDVLLSSIEKAKQSSEWMKDGGQFIPYPATWLNAKGWEDEYDTPTDPYRSVN